MTNTQKKNANFVIKLRQMLSNSSNERFISWDQDETAFCIHKPKEFELLTLPNYFRHSRFSSFVRQLNMYGFHKMRNTQAHVLKFMNAEFTKHSQQSDYKIVKASQNKQKCKEASVVTCAISDKEQESQSIEPIYQHDENQSKTPISDLMFELVEEIKSKEYLLEDDMENQIGSLLSTQRYRQINRKFIPFVYECLGLQFHKPVSNLFGSYSDLNRLERTSSLKFIL